MEEKNYTVEYDGWLIDVVAGSIKQARRAKMTRDELLRTVWLLDEVIESFRWIPVSERLPDESDYYCVTTEDTETDDRIEQTIWFAHKDDYDIEESEWRELSDYEKVIAWRKSDPYSPGN